MYVTVRGIYRDGAVTLLDAPPGLKEGPVQVTLSEESSPAPVLLQYGKYGEGTLSTEHDFEIAEWRGEDEDDGA